MNDGHGFLTRRALLQHAGALFGTSLAGDAAASAAEAPSAEQPAAPSGDALVPLNRSPRVMQEFFVARLREFEAAANARRARLQTGRAAEDYVADVRARIARSFGPLPEKTPLAPRVTGALERDGYRIEKVIFESRPGFPVTSNLYVPTGRPYPLPGVIALCGHSATGKAHDTYQSFVQGLARQGYVTLIFDPLGQGERAQYGGRPGEVPDPVREHLRAGNQQFLVGEFIGAWRAWDAIRAVDYLLTRPEVDPRHVGVTGNSGGGTLATWLWALEPRLTMAAPSCFVTTFRRNLENELSADTEQCPPGAIALGLDHADFIAANAPRPVLLLGQERDYFDVRGLEEAYARLRPLYRLLGAEQNIGLFVGPDAHGFHRANREAMYRWFNGITGVSSAREEPPIRLEGEETLRCTPAGQVAALGARSVFAFTREASTALRRERRPPEGAVLAAAVAEALRLPPREGAPDYRILRPTPGRRYPLRAATTYAVETEPHVLAFLYRLSQEPHLSRPPRGVKRALLYVSHLSADAELRDEPLVRELIASEPSSSAYACDVRGIGESQPNTGAESRVLHHYGADYLYASHGIMCDYPYVAQRTHDLLRVLDLLASFGHEEVHVAARGFGAIPATFAAVLSARVAQVTLKHAPTSYADIAEAEAYGWPLSAFVPGVLRRFDLPDLYAALAPRGLRLIEPRGAAGPDDEPRQR